MRTSVYLLFVVFVVASCSAINRIYETDDSGKGLKTIRLEQRPEVRSSAWKSCAEERYSCPVSLTYLFEEKQNSRPRLTLEVRIVTPNHADEPDSVMFFDLDNETIMLCDNANTDENNFHQHVSSIRQLKNKLFPDEKIKLLSRSPEHRQFKGNSASATTSGKISGESKTGDSSNPDKTINHGKIATERNNYRLINREFTIPENLWVPIARSENIRLWFYIGKEDVEIKPDTSETNNLKAFFDRATQRLNASFPSLPEGQKKW